MAVDVKPKEDGGTRKRMSGAMFQRLRRHPKITFSAAVLGVMVLLALFAAALTPHGPTEQDLRRVFEGPSSDYWLGTDRLGRDQLTRMLFGIRISLLASCQAVGLAVLIGVPTGLLAGYRGGLLETIGSRINDAIMSVPGLVLALTVIAALGPGLSNAMLAVGIILTPMLFRVGRAAALDVKQNTYIEAAVAAGCSPRRVLWAHIAPNAAGPLIVQTSMLFGYAVIAEASLSYLGLGVRPPTPSLGAMLAAASERLDLSYLLLGPGAVLSLLVLSFILLGDGLRDRVFERRGA